MNLTLLSYSGGSINVHDTNITSLHLGAGVPQRLKTSSLKYGVTFLRVYIGKYSKYIKVQNSLIINRCSVLI